CADEAANFEITSLNDDVMVSGITEGHTFDWNTSTLNIPEDGSSQTTNEFDVIVTHIATGCTSEAHVTVYVNSDPEVQNVEATYCADEATDFDITTLNDDVMVSGITEGYTFAWDTSVLNIPADGESQTTNEFDVIVTQITTGCTSEAHVTVYVNPDPAVKDVEATYCADEVTNFDIALFNDDVMVSGITEGYTFSWTGDLTIPEDGSETTTNIFNVIVTDERTGCTSETRVIITINPDPDVQTASATYCADEASDFDITSFNDDVMVSGSTTGYLYAWDGTLIIPEDGGDAATSIFNVVITDEETGNTSESSVTITVNPDPAVQNVEATYCADEVTDFDITSFNDDVMVSGNTEGYTFDWNISALN
ncbi:hypothetical protein, partial [Plebeiibacterium sediminum]